MIDSFYSSGNYSLFRIQIISLWISQWIVLPPSLINSATIWPIPGYLRLFGFPIANSISKTLGPGTGDTAVCISVCLTSLTPFTFNSREKYFLHLAKITLGVSNQIIFVILHYTSPRLVNLLKVIDAPIQVHNIFYHTVSFKFLYSSLPICLLFVPEMSPRITPYVAQIIYITLAWVMYPLFFSMLPLISKNLNILHQTMVHAASILAEQDSL